ncbi:hypothetical protein B0A55_04733 [Friedmanniomyces simplex]|uniref:Uncharacterized protein n=1 Tax=Friedmanniomyces simplex TaxID=329884 RepID=A0A4U0XM34_9PEZI|nr:hypothetical protein B0A55_04733 [Friedmanniomyces simplex]
MDAWLEKLADVPCVGVSTLPGCHCIEIIYSAPEYPENMAKAAVLDAFVSSGRSIHFDDMANHLPPPFTRDLCRAFIASRASADAAVEQDEQCRYHVHLGEGECNGQRARKRRRVDP